MEKDLFIAKGPDNNSKIYILASNILIAGEICKKELLFYPVCIYSAHEEKSIFLFEKEEIKKEDKHDQIKETLKETKNILTEEKREIIESIRQSNIEVPVIKKEKDLTMESLRKRREERALLRQNKFEKEKEDKKTKAKELKEMEQYLKLQNESNLSVGDIVIITRKSFQGENGWNNFWSSKMDEAIGEEGKILGFSRNRAGGAGTDVFIEKLHDNFYFPFFVLEKKENNDKKEMIFV